MGHPRDVCHAVSDGGDYPDGVVGAGSWDRDTYFRVNHGYATTAAWQAATGMTNPTRYEVYQWELRSEEHTSELQPLMRTSSAVFCWINNTRSQEDRKSN